MAHLQSQIKGGYYPLPPEHLPALASHFKAVEGVGSTNRGRILDPVAGEGDALQHLAQAWGLTPYANEIDADRAAACRDKFGLERAVCGDLMTLRTPNRAYSAVYVNPPYAENTGRADEKRREFEHLAHSWKWVQDGGFVLWVVYAQHMTQRAAAFLAARSSRVDVYRLPGLHLGTYPQIVVVAKARPEKQSDDGKAIELVTACQSPDAPCTVALTTTEWHALTAFSARSPAPPDVPPTLQQAVRLIAKLGGFIGRSADGDPGVKTLWRGWQRLQDIVATWLLLHPSQDVGNA